MYQKEQDSDEEKEQEEKKEKEEEEEGEEASSVQRGEHRANSLCKRFSWEEKIPGIRPGDVFQGITSDPGRSLTNLPRPLAAAAGAGPNIQTHSHCGGGRGGDV